VVAFISISSRRVEYFAITSKPDTPWMLQQARKLLMELDDHDRHVRFLIHDRDAKFPRAFDALLESDGVNVIHTPVRAPNANAHMNAGSAPSAANASTVWHDPVRSVRSLRESYCPRVGEEDNRSDGTCETPAYAGADHQEAA
jgi:hypothetical protein